MKHGMYKYVVRVYKCIIVFLYTSIYKKSFERGKFHFFIDWKPCACSWLHRLYISKTLFYSFMAKLRGHIKTTNPQKLSPSIYTYSTYWHNKILEQMWSWPTACNILNTTHNLSLCVYSCSTYEIKLLTIQVEKVLYLLYQSPQRLS